MSKRCELQKEYYKEFGNYKGEGKYSDHYVNWLESRILALTIPVVVGRSEQFVCKCKQPDDRSDHEIDRSCFKCGKPIAK